MSDVRNRYLSAKLPVAGSTVSRARRRGLPGSALGFAAAGVLALTLAGCDGGGEAADAPPAPLADDGAKASYSLGFRFADNVQRQFDDEIDNDAFVRGVRDNLAGEQPLVDDAEAERVLTAMMEARQAAVAGEALRSLEDGLAFLEENAKREEVVELESGLQYEVLEAAEGDKPGAEDVVTTHYEGRLIDGTVFDSSVQRGEPATFPLNRVIPGWTEGLQLMAPGSKYRLYVPPHLAYGDRPAGAIPPNSTLIFDVELLSIEAAGAATP
jgi:FKBP-type peptidyl-prolyl cis-trans isomerase